jgi:alpha-D-xyloside xylohydrolase
VNAKSPFNTTEGESVISAVYVASAKFFPARGKRHRSADSLSYSPTPMLNAALLGLLLNMPTPTPHWLEVEPGVWRTQIGAHDRPTLTEAAEAKPKHDRLKTLPQGDLPFGLDKIETQQAKEFSVVRIPLQPGEKIFGLGLQMNGADRRGGVYHLRVDHYASGHDRLHAPTPLYISSLGYAVFFNTSRPINVYVGAGNRLGDPKNPPHRDRNTDPHWDAQPDSGYVEASVENAGLEVCVLTGPTALNALQRYNLLCGGGAMPPEWALGFWHRTPLKFSAKQALEEAHEFAKRDFPLDVVGLEPGWQSSSYPGTMEWSPERFPDPAGFVKSLGDLGVHVNLWENPYVAPGSDLYKLLAPHFGTHTVWLGAAPDILDKSAATSLRQFHHDHHVVLGVSGYKIDEVDGFDEWLWPDHAQFPSGLSGIHMREIYGLLWQKELLRMFEDADRRTFGLVRSSNGAASRFPFAIYSDTYDHRQYVTALTNCSLAGVIWCAEIRSADTDEEWVRRMQSACLSPIAQLNAWDSGKKPWSYPAVETQIRDAMRLREALVPYLYTAFAQYHQDGIPPVRPMSLVDAGLETDQYMLGDNLLVAPMFAGEKSRKVRLPAGKWYDYQTGRYAGSAQTIEVTPSLDEIPLFVRGGTIIQTIESPDNVTKTPKSTPYLLRGYGDGPWQGTLYEDDGVTFAFEKGNFGLFHLNVEGETALAHHLSGNQSSMVRPMQFRKISP